MFLNIFDENNTLKKISEELYKYLGSNAALKGDYKPHITIGKSKLVQEIETISNIVSKLLIGNFNAQIQSINSKILVKDNDGNIYLENEIEFDLLKNNNKSL